MMETGAGGAGSGAGRDGAGTTAVVVAIVNGAGAAGGAIVAGPKGDAAAPQLAFSCRAMAERTAGSGATVHQTPTASAPTAAAVTSSRGLSSHPDRV